MRPGCWLRPPILEPSCLLPAPLHYRWHLLLENRVCFDCLQPTNTRLTTCLKPAWSTGFSLRTWLVSPFASCCPPLAWNSIQYFIYCWKCSSWSLSIRSFCCNQKERDSKNEELKAKSAIKIRRCYVIFLQTHQMIYFSHNISEMPGVMTATLLICAIIDFLTALYLSCFYASTVSGFPGLTYAALHRERERESFKGLIYAPCNITD